MNIQKRNVLRCIKILGEVRSVMAMTKDEEVLLYIERVEKHIRNTRRKMNKQYGAGTYEQTMAYVLELSKQLQYNAKNY